MRKFLVLFSFAYALSTTCLFESSAHAQPTTDARDYEGAGMVPNGTVVLLNYLRHQTTASKRNLTTNLDIFRAAYVLKFGKFAFVPFDAYLPVADADLKIYTNPANPLSPPSLKPQGVPIAGSVRNTGIGDLVYLPSAIYDHVENKENLTHTYAGLQLYVTMPTGNYASHNLVNIGENRWSFKPQIMLGQRFAKIVTTEFVSNVVAYTDNKSYSVTNPLGQRSIQHLGQKVTFNCELHLAVDLAKSAYIATSYYFSSFGRQYITASDTDVMEKAKVHTMRFTWGIRLEPQTLLLLQVQQDLSAGGEYSNSRYFGGRISHFFF
jgi:hypothetical protein